MTRIIELNHVWFSYGSRRVLEDVSLTISEGDFLAVIGPNGGGKTTLLKLLLGLIRPDRGEVRVLGRRPGKVGDQLGYLPQHTHVSQSFPATVLDVVMMGLVRPGLLGGMGLRRGPLAREAALRALDRVGMTDLAGRPVNRLSGGQAQRCFIARAIVSEPRLLLLDEPLSSVDPDGRNRLLLLLNELNAHMTIIMVNHDISVLSQGVKSVACVDRDVHLHPRPEMTEDMLRMSYGADGATCPVELVTHGNVPHRVLQFHQPSGSRVTETWQADSGTSPGARSQDDRPASGVQAGGQAGENAHGSQPDAGGEAPRSAPLGKDAAADHKGEGGER